MHRHIVLAAGLVFFIEVYFHMQVQYSLSAMAV